MGDFDCAVSRLNQALVFKSIAPQEYLPISELNGQNEFA